VKEKAAGGGAREAKGKTQDEQRGTGSASESHGARTGSDWNPPELRDQPALRRFVIPRKWGEKKDMRRIQLRPSPVEREGGDGNGRAVGGTARAATIRSSRLWQWTRSSAAQRREHAPRRRGQLNTSTPARRGGRVVRRRRRRPILQSRQKPLRPRDGGAGSNALYAELDDLGSCSRGAPSPLMSESRAHAGGPTKPDTSDSNDKKNEQTANP